MASMIEVKWKLEEMKEKEKTLPPEFNANSEYYRTLKTVINLLEWVVAGN